MGPVADDRQVWRIAALIEATEADALAAQQAIARALCPDPNHDGYCPVPWTTMACRFEDLDPEERAMWAESFEEDRRAAREAGESAT